MFSGLVNLLFGSPETDNSNITRRSTEPANTEPNQSVSDSVNPRSLSTEAAEEDGWLLVNKEEEEDSLPSTDSEEELPAVQTWSTPRFETPSASRRRCDAISALPHELTESLLFDVPLSVSITNNPSSTPPMEESWFVTPPPCFTSTGPVYMETSPYENLLIEHPSMSVYHSITYIQQLVRECNQTPLPSSEDEDDYPDTVEPMMEYIPPPRTNRKQRRKAEREMRSVRRTADLDNPERFIPIVKHRHSEKAHDKRRHQALCPNAIKRANKVRDVNGKGNRQRRSDLQHCRFVSRANNNRKC